VRQKVAIDEVEERPERAAFALGQLIALRTVGRGPVGPAIGRRERGSIGPTDGFGCVRLSSFALVEDAQEKNPGELRDVLEDASAVRAAENVADGPDGAVERLLRSEASGRG